MGPSRVAGLGAVRDLSLVSDERLHCVGQRRNAFLADLLLQAVFLVQEHL